MDFQYSSNRGHQLSEREHFYGKNVHLLNDPFLHSQLAKLCTMGVEQPWINELVKTIYTSLIQTVISHEFPQVIAKTASRMSEYHPVEGVFESHVIDPETKVVSVNLARAGTYPSHLCYQTLNYLMNPKNVRQDHISIARQTNEAHHVTGSQVSGHKIGGKIDDAIVLIPDPMGATGSTVIETLDLYRAYGKPKKFITLHCIVTPEYLKKVAKQHPEVTVYAIRLDRGLSSEAILKTVPGTDWDQEKGLNDNDYIVPGGGGFGEIMNNAFV